MKSIVKNSCIGFLDQSSNGIIWLFILSMFGREVGVVNFGRSLLAITCGEVFGLFADFGMAYMAVRLIAVDYGSSSAQLSRLFLLKAFLALPAFLVVGSFVWVQYDSAFFRLFCIASVAYLIKTIRLLVYSIFIAYERMTHVAICNLIYTAALAGTGYAFLAYEIKSAAVLLVAMLIGNLCATIMALALAMCSYNLSWVKPSLESVKGQFLECLPFGVFFLGTFLYFQIDIFLLSLMLDQQAVGIYQAAFRFVAAVEIVPAVIAMSTYPVVAKAIGSSIADARATIQRSIWTTMYLSLPIAAGMHFCAGFLILGFFGEEYAASIMVLQILSFVIPARAVAHLLGLALTCADGQRSRTKGAYIAAAGNVVLNLLLIPALSYYGAAIAVIVTSVGLVAAYYVMLQSQMSELPILKRSGPKQRIIVSS